MTMYKIENKGGGPVALGVDAEGVLPTGLHTTPDTFCARISDAALDAQAAKDLETWKNGRGDEVLAVHDRLAAAAAKTIEAAQYTDGPSSPVDRIAYLRTFSNVAIGVSN